MGGDARESSRGRKLRVARRVWPEAPGADRAVRVREHVDDWRQVQIDAQALERLALRLRVGVHPAGRAEAAVGLLGRERHQAHLDARNRPTLLVGGDQQRQRRRALQACGQGP
jgi:hypothetical protein